MKILIKGAYAVKADCSGFDRRDLLIEDGKIVDSLSGEPDKLISAEGKYLLPGLIDIHTHGSFGVSYYGAEGDLERAMKRNADAGVTTVIATVGVRPEEELITAIENVKRNAAENVPGAKIRGIHLEGPFVSQGKLGVMKSDFHPCSIENFEKFYAAADGMLKVMTIAPERESAPEVIAEGARRGVRMSLGHTLATYEEAMAGIEAGATGSTHTFNAMVGLTHREPGVLGAVLTDPRVSCEAICDMVHLAPATVRLIAAAKGKERMILVSDTGLISGLGDGDYVVDGLTRYVRDGVARNASGNIAGSTRTMAYGARKLVELGFTLADIARVGAKNPAEAIGIYSEVGTLEVGKCADVIICDEHFSVERVLVGDYDSKE